MVCEYIHKTMSTKQHSQCTITKILNSQFEWSEGKLIVALELSERCSSLLLEWPENFNNCCPDRNSRQQRYIQ